MNETRTKILEAARRIAFVWKASPATQDSVRNEINRHLADDLDELLRLCGRPEKHPAFSRTITERGRAENGYQPETKYVWVCSCRKGKSGDMGSSTESKIAANTHLEDPTQFPGWLE